MDGSFLGMDNTLVGIGIITRDSCGKVLDGKHMVVKASSPFVIEALTSKGLVSSIW